MKRSFSARDAGLSTTSRLALRFYAELDCPRSLTLFLLVKHGEWDQVATLGCDPLQYCDPLGFHKAYLATAFLSKYEGLPTTFNKADAALSKFHEGEAMCKETNTRLIRTWDAQQGAVRSILGYAVENVSRLLGPVDREVLEDVLSLAKWGNGVTSSCKGLFLSQYDKVRARPDVTPEFHAVFGNSILDEFPHWAETHPDGCAEVGGNRVGFVPKNAKTDRSIAVEPTVNALVQRGVGRLLKRRLRKWGVNLSSQALNQELAREGSVADTLATIDLSMASDTVSRECVYRLLPEDWGYLLDTLRSWRYTIGTAKAGSEWHRYEKHSSMGNGYTFELETLIFASVVRAVYRYMYGHPRAEPYAVYGDDIVVTKAAYPLVVEVLEYLGFRTNGDKSFSHGPFRESCGSDWFDGVPVRPFFFKKSDDVLQIMEWANWLRCSAPPWLEITSLWLQAFKAVPQQWRVRVPKGGPTGFIVNQWESNAKSVWSPLDGWCYRFRAVRFKPKRRQWIDDAASLSTTLSRMDRRRLWRPLSGDEPEPVQRFTVGRDVGTWDERPAKSIDWPLVRLI